MDEPAIGFKIGEVAYVVIRLPGRKNFQLVRQEGCLLKPVATFRKDSDAEEFKRWFTNIPGSK